MLIRIEKVQEIVDLTLAHPASLLDIEADSNRTSDKVANRSKATNEADSINNHETSNAGSSDPREILALRASKRILHSTEIHDSLKLVDIALQQRSRHLKQMDYRGYSEQDIAALEPAEADSMKGLNFNHCSVED